MFINILFDFNILMRILFFKKIIYFIYFDFCMFLLLYEDIGFYF